MNDWALDILAAAAERGWWVALIDARATMVVLDDMQGTVIKIAGLFLTGDYVRQMPQVHNHEPIMVEP